MFDSLSYTHLQSTKCFKRANKIQNYLKNSLFSQFGTVGEFPYGLQILWDETSQLTKYPEDPLDMLNDILYYSDDPPHFVLVIDLVTQYLALT